MKEALFYQKLDGAVRCGLCNHFCRITPGKRGICGVRENQDGELKTLVYGRLIAMNVDPIEKKPLYHFLPGSLSYSIATVGCNFRCKHCQNADISQLPADAHRIAGEVVEPEEVVASALQAGVQSISYTYTEPTIFFEYALDVAVLAQQAGLKNVFVSNGYMSQEAVLAISPYLDAVNVDLKGDSGFYRQVCGAELEPVKQNIRLLWDLGIWVEVTTLVIPGYNDSEDQLREIARFLASVDRDMPWHVTAFYPTYKLRDARRTSAGDLRRALQAGREAGLRYVYAGNIPGESDQTICPQCGEVLVDRYAMRTLRNSVVEGGCPSCHTPIAGRW
ncbi:MAG: AmmeMemoRadiSam system radical SAM enzyme [Methanosarcinales archaeon]|nr:AmmeMemoRadiSam system radical SAM enzyme [Methanosarcinales archaeon]